MIKWLKRLWRPPPPREGMPLKEYLVRTDLHPPWQPNYDSQQPVTTGTQVIPTEMVTVSMADVQRVYDSLNMLNELVPYNEKDGPLDIINKAELLGLLKHVEAQELRRDWNHVRCYEEGIPLPGASV